MVVLSGICLLGLLLHHKRAINNHKSVLRRKKSKGGTETNDHQGPNNLDQTRHSFKQSNKQDIWSESPTRKALKIRIQNISQLSMYKVQLPYRGGLYLPPLTVAPASHWMPCRRIIPCWPKYYSRGAKRSSTKETLCLPINAAQLICISTVAQQKGVADVNGTHLLAGSCSVTMGMPPLGRRLQVLSTTLHAWSQLALTSFDALQLPSPAGHRSQLHWAAPLGKALTASAENFFSFFCLWHTVWQALSLFSQIMKSSSVHAVFCSVSFCVFKPQLHRPSTDLFFKGIYFKSL